MASRRGEYNYEQPPLPVTLPSGVELRVDRIYIKKATKNEWMNKDGQYNSVTFCVTAGPLKGARFWAKLPEVNTIHCTIKNVVGVKN